MAMTKKERKEFDDAIEHARRLGALRWTSPVARDVPQPSTFEYSSGYDYNAYSLRTNKAWSSSVSHGDGDAPKPGEGYRSASQGARRLYSSELLALKAMRCEIETEGAIKLAAVDAMIAEASK